MQKQALLGLLNQACNPNQDYGTHKGSDNRAEDTTTRPYAQQAKQPAPDYAAEKAKNDVHQDAIAAALHHLASQPAGNQPN